MNNFNSEQSSVSESSDSSAVEIIFDENGSIHSSNPTHNYYFNIKSEQLHGQNILDYLENIKEQYKLKDIIKKLIVNPLAKYDVVLSFSYNNLKFRASCECSMESMPDESYFVLRMPPPGDLNKQESAGQANNVEAGSAIPDYNYLDYIRNVIDVFPVPVMVVSEEKVISINKSFLRLMDFNSFEELHNTSFEERFKVINIENGKGKIYINSFKGKNYISYFFSEGISNNLKKTSMYFFIPFSKEELKPVEIVKSLIDSINNAPVLYLNSELEFVHINAESIKLTGYTPGELNRRPITDLLHSDSGGQFIDEIRNVSENQSGSKQIEIIDKKGVMLSLNMTILKLQNIYLYENYFYILILYPEINNYNASSSSESPRDIMIKNDEMADIKNRLQYEINLRKEAEKKLHLNDERLRHIDEITEEGIWDLDFSSGDINYNKKFCEIFDFNSETCRDCYITHYESSIVEADRHKFKEAMEKHIAGETPGVNVEHRIKTCNNAYKWVLSKGKVVLRDDVGNPIKFMGRIEDISLRKLAEEEIEKSHRIANELVENKSRFVSMISHEFRTPLSTILSSSDLLRSFGSELTTEEKEKQFDRIEKAVDTLTELLNDILTLNKTDSERQNIKTEEIEIISLCKYFIEEVSSSCKDAPIIDFSSNVDRYIIQSDEKLLRQIIINLLTNAIKYNRDNNKVKFRIEIDTNITIVIEDKGIGIKQEDQANLFTPFFRGANTSGIPGTGLGLAIVKSSVDSLNGELRIKSEPGAGSSFYVKFNIKHVS